MTDRRMIVNESRPYSFDQELRVILSFPEGREALKALLTEDGPRRAAYEAADISGRRFSLALAAALDELDSPEGDT